MRLSIAVGLLVVAVAVIFADEGDEGLPDDSMCLPLDAFNQAFPDGVPNQSEYSDENETYVCVPWEDLSDRSIGPEKRLIGGLAVQGAARTMACGSTRCK